MWAFKPHRVLILAVLALGLATGLVEAGSGLASRRVTGRQMGAILFMGRGFNPVE